MKRICMGCHKPHSSTKSRCKSCEGTKRRFDDVIEAKRRELEKRGLLPHVETIRNKYPKQAK